MTLDLERNPLVVWPLFTIDFEASSLAVGTFPIEVGVCRWISPDRQIEGWSTLIRLLPEWDAEGSWSPASQAIHGISRAELETGMTATEVITVLNRVVGTGTAYCDGGIHDVRWASMLARGSNEPPSFTIGDFDHLALCADPAGYRRLVHWLDRAPTRHRALDDAERLMVALAHGFGLDHGTPTAIVIHG